MKAKRLLTLMLVLCMLFSCIAPVATATTGADAYSGAEITELQLEATEAASAQKPEVITSENGTTRLATLRDDLSGVSVESGSSVQSGEDTFSAQANNAAAAGSVTTNSAWSATLTEKPSGLDLTAELPASVTELREAAETYSASEVVSAFVVLEQEPLVNQYSDINSVPAKSQTALERQQSGVIAAIEEDVLGGATLQVDRQFTYLANAFSITTEFGNLEAIAQIPGVKSVFLMPVYHPVTDDTLVVTGTTYEPYTVSSGGMTGVPTVWEELGLTGSGMTIAIIDTGLDLDHPSFAADPADASMTTDSIAAVLENLNAYKYYMDGVTASDLYRSEKIPYAFNYVDANLIADHSSDSMGDHGTHVAGIAAANAVDGSGVVGMAPDAQLLVMKVFGANGGAYSDDIVAALEDALTLGADVVNLSLGSSAGFTSSAEDFIDSVYAGIAQTATVVNISAGNDGTSSYGNLWGTDMNTTSNPDNAAVGSPSTYVNVNSIASVDNAQVVAPVLSVGGVDYMYSEANGLYVTFDSLAGQELEYVMVPGLGEAADFEGLDVAGKVAVIARGSINFALKLANAEANGAIGVVITNNVAGSISNFGMSMTDDDGNLMDGVSGWVPCVLVSLDCGEYMAAQETKILTVYDEMKAVVDEAGGQMSSFSSWGPDPALGLAPDMAGVGGSVYSCYDGGTYGLMSGTSMSAPQVSGMTALVKEYLKEVVGITDAAELREMTNALLMSTAEPVVDIESEVEASPRQQGAGLVNAYNAVTSEAYVTVAGKEDNKPKAELGASADGSFSFTFTVHNFSSEDKTYELTASLLTEDVIDYVVEQFMAGYDTTLGGSVTFSQNTVTVPADGTADVTVTITLNADGKSFLDTYYPNGGYVEGFVYLTNADGVDLSIPYLGFYGDWSEAPAFDTAYWYDNSFWGVDPVGGLPEGNEYYNVFWTDLGSSSWVLGINPYVGATQGDDGNIVYDPANNVISNNGDGYLDNLSEIYLSLMRNATHLYFSYQVDGEEVYWQDAENAWKTMYLSNYGSVIPYVHSWWFSKMYDFTDIDGNPLPSGTQIDLVITATLEAEGAYQQQSITIPLTLDWNAPELVETGAITTTSYADRLLMTLRFTDESTPAYAALLTPSGSTILSDSDEFTKMADGSYTVVLDITDLGSEFTLALCDYGANEAYYTIKLEGSQLPADGNKPEVDSDALYAYRVYDAAIWDDSLYGWITIDKETAETTQLTNDMYEDYAINAAEYVDGYIFAVDAGYNFLVMEPGLFFRKTICNLGVNVLDMTFNKADDTMYVTTRALTEDGYSRIYTLSTLDLLTGELTTLAESTSAYALPYAMAATDDGEIYAIKYYYNGLYKVNQETWTLEAVTDADGNAITLTRANGNYATPYYAQSMTYSSADECIYYAFFTYTSDAELFTIDVSGEYPTMSAVEFPVDAECVGLLTLDEDDYTLPQGEAVAKLLLSAESLNLIIGETAQLSTSILPWNYEPAEDIVWTSSDASIASVTNGVITAVSAGTATITATCEGVSASCMVNVVNVKGTLYAYDSFNYTGDYEDWISIDLAEMSYTSLYDSPVDFMAADYNGHDGNIYGYDLNGQFYRFNPETGECVALGSAVTLVPADMAYDYSSGYMYAVTVDESNYCSTLQYVNMNTGALVDIAQVYDFYLTLACDTEGGLYAISSAGVLYYLFLYEADMGGGWLPLSAGEAAALSDSDVTMMLEPVYIMEGLGTLYYGQSMCFDHNNRVLLWANPETVNLFWIDIFAYEPYALALGDPTGSGLFQFMGLYTIPEEIEPLPYTPVTDVTAEDMLVLVGGRKLPTLTIEPLNATNQNYTLTSADETVAKIENGMVVGIAEGSTTVNGILFDEGETYEFSFDVVVKTSTGKINGFIVSDFYSGGGEAWAVFNDQDPTNSISYPGACGYLLYAEEYVDGKLYAYGYNSADWEAAFQFMIIDEATYEIETLIDMGDAFPFVYDMTFDYTTGTMFAVAGANDSSSDLYMVDMETGVLIPCMETEPFFTSLTASEDGTLYAISASAAEYDPWSWTYVYSNAMLYELDVENGTYEVVFDLGIQCNRLASMAYDYDTGNIYWSPVFQASYWDPITVNGLYLIDLEAEAIFDLGKIGYAGSQVTGMYILADAYPEIPEELMGLALTSTKAEMSLDATLELSVFIRPAGCDADLEWSSSNESVAIVDENGVVTAVGSGSAIITVSATDANGKLHTSSCTIVIYSADDCYLTYNCTDGGFAKVLKSDPTVVINLTEGETDPAVRSMAMVDGVIYAYDDANDFFSTTVESGFERTYLGAADVEEFYPDTETEDFFYTVRDLAWDATNERMLALVNHSMTATEDWDGMIYEFTYELTYGNEIYEVNLETGELTYLATLCDMYGDYIANAYTLTVDENGVVYIYSSYDDYVSTVDLETGMITQKTTLQNQGLYGSSDGESMAMDYDPTTGNVYMLFTQNGSSYSIVSYSPSNAAMALISAVGESVYNPDTYVYESDLFAGLIVTSIKTEEDCQHLNVTTVGYVAPTATTAGYSGDTVCSDCGQIVKEGRVLPATGGIVVPETPSTDADSVDTEDVSACEKDDDCVVSSFTDCDPTLWYHNGIHYCVVNGIMKGTSATTFGPNNDLTRQQIWMMLARISGEDPANMAEAKAWAVEAGISDGTNPTSSVTRQQLATMLWRYAKWAGVDVSVGEDTNILSYTDVSSVSEYAIPALQWSTATGVVGGYSDGTLRPLNIATRAQAAAMIQRFCENVLNP